jgi:prevent-host-death family protein
METWKVARVSSTEARRRLPELVNATFDGERFIVEKNGIPVAAIVPFTDLGIVKQAWPEIERRNAPWDALRAAFRDVPQDELDREVAAALASARADIRRERAGQRARKAS